MKIPNLAVKLPFSLHDTMFGGFTLHLSSYAIGQMEIASASLGVALLSFSGLSICRLIDNHYLKETKEIDFQADFGINLAESPNMPLEERLSEIRLLTEKLNDEYTVPVMDMKELSKSLNNAITDYILSITGQEIITSEKFREKGLMTFFMPNAIAGQSILGSEIFYYGNSGIYNAFILGHELVHRKGYRRELETQLITYLALSSSGNPIFTQSANVERLSSQIHVCEAIENKEWVFDACYQDLRPELKEEFDTNIFQEPSLIKSITRKITYPLHQFRMKLSNQDNSDYSLAFTNCLYAMKIKI